MPTEPDNMMADIQSVMAKMREPAAEPDAGPTEDAPTLTEPSAETPEPKEEKPADGRVHDPETGRFLPKPKETPAAKKTPEVQVKPKLAAVPKPPDAPLTEAPKVEAPAPTAPVVKAPSAWRPEVREKWAGLPPDVQAEIARREREMSVGLGQASTHKQEAERWRSTVAPFEMMFRADGLDAPKAVGNLLGTVAALRTSPGPVKAGIVANIIKQYGVGIEELASALDGTQTPQHVAARPGAYQDPRVDQLIATLQAQATERQAAQQREAEAALAKIQESNEFYDDLREDAADFYEAAAKRGKPITLERAFELAAHANPEVAKVQTQRKAAEEAKAKAAEAAKKRQAASSIRGAPPPPPVDGDDTDGSLRGDLEAVARKLASR